MPDIAKWNGVAVSGLSKINGRTMAGGDKILGLTWPSGLADIIESIQEVEFTIASSATTGTATITSVDTSKTAIFFSTGMFGGRRQTSVVNGGDHILAGVDLTNATTVTATRNTSQTFALTIICTVVEFKTAAVDSIQQGTITISSTNTSNTDTITSVSTSNSVAVFNGCTSTMTGTVGGRGMCTVSLTNATTVTATRADSNNAATAYYVVIEFASGVVDSMQEFDISISNSLNTTNTATISSVTTAQSCIFPGGYRSDFGQFITLHDAVCYAELTNSTTVTATRNTASSFVPSIAGTIVEFNSTYINNIQRGVITMATGDTTDDTTITSVDIAKSMVNAIGATSTSTATIDTEEQTFTVELLNSTTIRATKNVTGRDVIFSYEVVEFT